VLWLIHNIRPPKEEMNMKTKVTLLALSVLLAVGMVPATSWAQDNGVAEGEANSGNSVTVNSTRTAEYYATLQPDKYSPDSYLNRKPVRTSETGGYASNELTVWTDRYLNNLEANEIIESTGGILIRRSGVDEYESGLIFDILIPDALTASSLAGAYDAPIILTAPDKLSAQTRSLLMSLGVIKAIVVGGPPAVSDKVFSEIQQLVPDTIRIAGPDRFATARMVYCETNIASNNFDAYRDVAIIADGGNYPDALSIAPYAFSDTVPIFLSDKVNGLDADTAMTIKSTFSKIILVGGSNVVPDKVKVQLGYAADDNSSFVRLAGDDRYQTSARIAEYINIWSQKLRFHRLCVTTGKNYPDALAGGVFAGRQKTVLVLADDDIIGRSSVDGVVRAHNQYIGTGSFLGSEAVMPKSLADRFQVAARGLILVEQLPT
jgi:putative cell wall-binding protein